MATFINQTKNTVTFTNQSETVVNTLATAGLYYGFGCFTYSGGEILSTAPVSWSNGTKNTATFTNQTKN